MRMAFVLITGLVLTYYTIHNSVGYLKRLQNCTTILYILFTRIYLLHYIIQTRFSFVYPFAFAFAFLFIILFLCLVFSMSFTFACFALVYVIGCIYLMQILFFFLSGLFWCIHHWLPMCLFAFVCMQHAACGMWHVWQAAY